jgi:hypothetical protein
MTNGTIEMDAKLGICIDVSLQPATEAARTTALEDAMSQWNEGIPQIRD